MGKQNDQLLKNIEEYDKKKKAEQQESEVRKSKPNTGKDNKKKRTRLYHI